MDPGEERRLVEEAEAMAERSGDLRAQALLKMATGARPGLVQDSETWIDAADEASRLADESGDLHLRVAIRAASAYARLHAGQLDAFEVWLDDVIELAGDDPAVGAGIVIGNPLAWAYMGKATVRRERGEFDEAERLLEFSLRLSDQTGDPESASWIRGTQAMLRTARGDLDGGVALNRRNCELTERLGDVFSRSLALTCLSYSELAVGDAAAALESIEEAERLYQDAMGSGGEMETWRAGLLAEALLGVGRAEEAVEVARDAAAEGRRLGRLWSLPLTLLAQGRAEASTGDAEGARATLDEAAEIAAANETKVSLEAIEGEREALGAGAR
jgi:tetratricopeptide (TPR) repeat protein